MFLLSKISNKNILFFAVTLIIILVAVVYWRQNDIERPYYAVYLENGDIYFGKLRVFPYLSLSNAYFLQKNPSDSQNPFSVLEFGNAFWYLFLTSFSISIKPMPSILEGVKGKYFEVNVLFRPNISKIWAAL